MAASLAGRDRTAGGAGSQRGHADDQGRCEDPLVARLLYTAAAGMGHDSPPTGPLGDS